jgi:hypothetical protein
VSLDIVGLDAEQDVDPSPVLLLERKDLLDVAGKLLARHRESGVRVVAGEEVEREVVREGDLRETAGEGRLDVLAHRPAGVPAAGRMDVVVGAVICRRHRPGV